MSWRDEALALHCPCPVLAGVCYTTVCYTTVISLSHLCVQVYFRVIVCRWGWAGARGWRVVV